MPRVFLSHSSRNSSEAIALKRWLVEQDPGLEKEIFLDLDPHTGIAPGERWKEALRQANERCEAVICLLSSHWEASRECLAEYRTAENLGKLILCARLEPLDEKSVTGEWQRCDLFGEGPATEIQVSGRDQPVVFLTEGLQRLHRGLQKAGIGAEHFTWPPPTDPDRAPYRGWEPLEEMDAAVFFGRDGQIVRGMDDLRGMRRLGLKSMFMVLGPSGTGKSSFLRAGLVPRLRRDDRQFLVLDIVRPERNVLTGDRGLAPAIHTLRALLGLRGPTLGEIKAACTAGHAGQLQEWLAEARQKARARLLDASDEAPAPTVVLPLDQAEELFSADAGPEAPQFLGLLARLLHPNDGTIPALILAGTIRADFYEVFQTAPELAELKSDVFDELKPMPVARFREVILGPAARATEAGRRLEVEPALVDRLMEDSVQGADTLPLLALTLARLYRDYGGDGNLTLAEYEAMGGLQQVVQREISTLLSRDPAVRDQQLELLHSAFIPWLATINPDNDQPTRRIARLADLPAESRPLINAMVEKRLLVRDERDGETVIEVALESLLRQWKDLARWLAAERENLKEADSLERAAAAWERSQRNDAWLLEGERLAGAESLAAKPGFRDRLDPAWKFLVASRRREEDRAAAEKRRQEAELQAARAHTVALRKRSHVLMMVLAAAVVIAAVALYYLVQFDRARSEADARTREGTALRLVSEAQLMLVGTRPEGSARALKEMLAAQALVPTAEGEGALLHAVVTQRDLQKIMEATAEVLSVSFSPDGRRIASGGADVRIWDADTGQSLGEPLTGHWSWVWSVAFSPDGHRLVSGGSDGTVRLWDADTGGPLGDPLTGHNGPVSSVAFSPDGHHVISGGDDGTVRRWNADTGQPLGDPLRGHAGRVNSVAFSPAGRHIASGGEDGTVRRWDADTGRPLGDPLRGHESWVYSVAFSPDGRRIASGGNDGTVRRWDADTGRALGDPLRGHESWVYSVAFSPDGHRIVSGGQDGRVQIWDADTGGALGDPLRGHESGVWSVAFSPDAYRIASGGQDGTLRTWDADTGWADDMLIGHEGPVYSVAFSPDGHRIASGGEDGTVRIWDADTGWPLGEPITGHEGPVKSVAFSPEGDRIASGGQDGTVRIRKADTGGPLGFPMKGREGPVNSVAFSPDGHRLVSAQSGTLRIWDVVDLFQPLGEPMRGHEGPVNSVTFSSDGRHIASGSEDGKVRMWDAETRQALQGPLTRDEGPVKSVAFSPDGHRLVFAQAGTVQIWDADNGLPFGALLEGHRFAVFSVTFSPDGRRVVSGGEDGTVRIWDADTGRPLGVPLRGHESAMFSVAFSPDGRRIAAGNGDTLRLWPGPPLWRDALCGKLTQNISHEQWREWVSPDIDYLQVCPGLPIPPDGTPADTNSR